MSNFVSTVPQFFCDFSFISNVFIKIHKYSNLIFSNSNHKIKVLCLSIDMVPFWFSGIICSLDIGTFVGTTFNFYMIFTNIHEYGNQIICISDHQIQMLCL